jgi:hypothetical protein
MAYANGARRQTRYVQRMRLSLAVSSVVISCMTACSPVEVIPSVVVKAGSDSEPLLKTTNENLSPGDIVHLWHYSCSRQHGTHCGYGLIATGMVTTVVTDKLQYATDKVQYAFVQVAPGTHVSVGDRAVKPSPMSYWHPDEEAPF